MKDLESVHQYFELINFKAFCEKYGLSYESYRLHISGKRPLTAKVLAKISAAVAQYEADQDKILNK